MWSPPISLKVDPIIDGTTSTCFDRGGIERRSQGQEKHGVEAPCSRFLRMEAETRSRVWEELEAAWRLGNGSELLDVIQHDYAFIGI
jgi:hypothetical protein